jgi:hypothetical protein
MSIVICKQLKVTCLTIPFLSWEEPIKFRKIFLINSWRFTCNRNQKITRSKLIHQLILLSFNRWWSIVKTLMIQRNLLNGNVIFLSLYFNVYDMFSRSTILCVRVKWRWFTWRMFLFVFSCHLISYIHDSERERKRFDKPRLYYIRYHIIIEMEWERKEKSD